jgi:hypothetical protein
MRIEFNQGVPEGCTQWLREHVGLGNIEQSGNRTQEWTTDSPDYAWFYKRESLVTSPLTPDRIKYVPTITIKDDRLATWFLLRWGQHVS